MNLNSRDFVVVRRRLTRLLLATLVLGIASSDTTSSVGSQKPNDNSLRNPRKYLELDDLNAYESSADARIAASHDAGSEEAFEYHPKSNKPKKLVRRQATVQQQQQQNPTRDTRQINQAKKQRPGFFWTIAKATYETFNDTRSAISQIGQIINEGIPPDHPKKKPKPSSANLKKPIGGAGKASSNASASASATVNTGTTQAPPETTTEEFKLTRPLLQSLVRRNVLGLVRLFNIEWRDAINESKNSIREFRSDLGKQIGMYLQDNPNNY